MTYFPSISIDYTVFLEKWLAIFSEKGFAAFKDNFSDYNWPYLYILWFLEKIPGYGLYKIKIFSTLFDISLVILVFKLIKLKYGNLVSLFASLCVWSCPTIMINSSGWGQCDAIYVFFLILSLYYLLQKEGNKAAFAFAASFVFKFQAIFLLPFYGILFFNKTLRDFYNIKLYYIVYPFIFYYICGLPVILIGYPVIDLLSFKNYFYNTLSYDYQMAMNGPTIYYFLPGEIFTNKKVVDIWPVFVVILFCIELCLIKISNNLIYYFKKYFLLMAQIFTIIFIFLLPKMHDRYFYICDLLSIIIFFYYPSIFLAISAFFIIFASILSYNLFYNFFPVYRDMPIPAAFMLIGILFLIFDFYRKIQIHSKYIYHKK